MTPLNQMAATRIPGADAPLEISWDTTGIPHVFADTIEDAYRGMGYACASERLWQLHLSNLYATGTAAAVMGERFVTQDLMHRVFRVPAWDMPESPGDRIVDAYLQGLNAYIDQLTEVPPEFLRAGTEPRHVTRHDVASRYRFTGWFQHKSWLEKIALGRLMSRFGTDWFKRHLLRFSAEDEAAVSLLSDSLQNIDLSVARLLFPTETSLSGSNNWAVTGGLSASGYPMLATDPHQPHGIPNTFFYAHLSTPGWDAFGASFPGVPYFMMGFNRELAWGLTTGFVDSYDVFIERERPDVTRDYVIDVKGQDSRRFAVAESSHGPILESLTEVLGFSKTSDSSTALDWAMRDNPTSAGTLALLPLAGTSEEFGDALFEQDVSPLVNNIICVDRSGDLRRFIAATLRKRTGATGMVPLPGWQDEYHFEYTKASEMLVEHNPDCQYSLTANNDTMGSRGDFPIHNFPADSARADRIRELLTEKPDAGFTVSDFMNMQLDLTDLRAKRLVPDIIASLDMADPIQSAAVKLLDEWDFRATMDAPAPSLYYPFLEKRWQYRFMRQVLGDDPWLNRLAGVASGLNRFSFADFTQPDSPWLAHRDLMVSLIRDDICDVANWLTEHHPDATWGDLHKIRFANSLSRYSEWQHLKLGPDPIGGSPTTLAMAMHNPPGKDTLAQEVFHGPAFRWVVDLADPLHFQFVIAGGNGGRPDSPFLTDHYQDWLNGRYHTMSLVREELDVDHRIEVMP